MDLNSSQSGTIITFYSYKGGSGRSMAVANIACLLAKRVANLSQRVLVMDWDLEAPGLHWFNVFAERSEQPENVNRPGVINYFDDLRQLLSKTPNLYAKMVDDPEGWKLLDEKLPLDDYLISDVVPGVDFVKAGRFEPHYIEYIELVSSFDWASFYRQYNSAIRVFRELLVAKYAYCLVDLRTGFTDISGICTALLPEKLVAVFTPNLQSLSGLRDVLARAVEYRRASDDLRPLAIFPLPSRIELAEKDLREKWGVAYQHVFQRLFRQVYEVEECDLTAYFYEVLLPHVSYYAYGESIAVREERSDALSLTRAYERFLERLVELDFAWEETVEEQDRRIIESYGQNLTIAREVGDRYEEGKALSDLGNAYFALGETHRAIEFYERSLAVFREIGNRRGEGNTLTYLSGAYWNLGETEHAIEFYEQALFVFREIGDRPGEGNALGNLGIFYWTLGDISHAIDYYKQALEVFHEIGDRPREREALSGLASAYSALGETHRAIEFYEQLLTIAREVGNRLDEANSLYDMSVALAILGDHVQAIARAEAALQIYKQIEDPNAAKVRERLVEWREQTPS